MAVARDPSGTLWVRLLRWSPEDLEALKRLPRRNWHPARRAWSLPPDEASLKALRGRFPEVPEELARIPLILVEGNPRGGGPDHPPGPPSADGSPEGIEGPAHPGASACPEAPEVDRSLPAEVPSPPLSHPALDSLHRKDLREEEDVRVLERVEEELLLVGYAVRTRKNYLGYIRRFGEWSPKPLAETGAEEVRDYLLHLVQHRKVSRSARGQALGALRFLTRRVLGRASELDLIPMPRRSRQLPGVLSREEVEALLRKGGHPTRKALLMLLYSAGLRVGELVRLRPEDLQPVCRRKNSGPSSCCPPHAPYRAHWIP